VRTNGERAVKLRNKRDVTKFSIGERLNFTMGPDGVLVQFFGEVPKPTGPTLTVTKIDYKRGHIEVSK
jgi:hypothetical protein